MSDTPRTDELAKREFVPDGLWIRHGRELERENAALKLQIPALAAANDKLFMENLYLGKDKQRLDWLSSQKDQPWLYWERPLRLTREAIDAFRKEAQP